MKRAALAVVAATTVVLAAHPVAAQIDFSGLNQYQGLQGQMCPVVGCGGGGASVGGGGVSRAAQPPAPPSPQAAINAMALQMGMTLVMAAIQEAQDEAEAEAQRQAQWQAEMARLAGIEQQRTDAQRQRLLGAINTAGLTTGGSVSHDDSLSTGGSFSRSLDMSPPDTTTGLTLVSLASQQLTAAAYFSQLAVNANSDEAAAALAEKAFDSAMGFPTDVAVPPSMPAVSVGEEELPQIEMVRQTLNKAVTDTHDAVADWTQQQQQVTVAQGIVTRIRGSNDAATVQQAQQLLNQAQLNAQTAAKALDAEQTLLATQQIATMDYFTNFLPGYRPYDPKTAYVRGLSDGADCLTSNAAHFCAKLDSGTTSVCIANYSKGFQAGLALKAAHLKDAYNIGKQTLQASRPLTSTVYQESVGMCGAPWVQAYNAGYFGQATPLGQLIPPPAGKPAAPPANDNGCADIVSDSGAPYTMPPELVSDSKLQQLRDQQSAAIDDVTVAYHSPGLSEPDYKAKLAEIREKFVQQDPRESELIRLKNRYDGRLQSTGRNISDVRSDVDLSTGDPNIADAVCEDWKSIYGVEAVFVIPGGVGCVNRTLDSTMWRPCPANDNVCNDARNRYLDAYATTGGRQALGLAGEVKDPYGYGLDLVRKLIAASAANNLGAFGKLVYKIGAAADLLDEPADALLWDQAHGLHEQHGVPEAAKIVAQGQDAKRAQIIRDWQIKAAGKTLEALARLKQEGAAMQTQRRQAIADPKISAAKRAELQKEYDRVQRDNVCAEQLIRNAWPKQQLLAKVKLTI